MAQKTNLNVAPYYDDFNSANNFNRILFRPGFAVQGRELTQLQTALQDQIRKHGDHVFEEGAMVLPGQISFSRDFDTLKLATQFNSENISISQYYNATTPVTITGATTGVKARVTGFSLGSTTEQPVLYIRYMDTGTDNTTATFADGENISADIGITHTTSYSTNVASATTFTATSTSKTDPKGPAAAKGSVANVESGIYYIRGMFIENTEQSVVLSKYNVDASARVGFTIEEKIVTPEADSTLLDNANGSNNFAAKGGHRLQINLTLSTLSLNSIADDNFVELMKIDNGMLQSKVRTTEYSVLEETFARRTFDESGDYTVRPFQFTTNECVTIDDEEGFFTTGSITDDGNTASENLLAFKVSPGKAYVKGFEIEKLAPTIKDVNKARDTNSVNNGVSIFNLGNYTFIQNIHHQPDITADGGSTITPFGGVEFTDTQTAVRGQKAGTTIGLGRVRHMEYHSGTATGGYLNTVGNNPVKFKLYLFDIKPFTYLTLTDTPSPTLLATHSAGGVQLKGATSGATGFVADEGTSATNVYLTNVVGTFVVGEKLIASDSAEDGGLIENSSNADIEIASVRTYSFSDFRQVYQNTLDTAIDFTADLSLDNQVVLSGSYRSETSGTDNLIGVSGFNTNEVSVGDLIEIPTGSGGTAEGRTVDAVTSTAISFTSAPTTDAIVTSTAIRKRATLNDAEKNIGVIKMSKDVIKTSSDITYSVRRQFIRTVSSGVATIGSLTNETYAPTATTSDYTISMISENSGSTVEIGAIFDNIASGDMTSSQTGKVQFANAGGSATQTIDFKDGNNDALEDSDKIKILATISRNSNVDPKLKTPVLSKAVKVVPGTTDAFGSKPTDKTISLGRADTFKLQAVYDSEATGTDAVPPKLTIGVINGAFTRGEVITGGTSGAKARIITSTNPMYYVLNTDTDFSVGETITGVYTGATTSVSAVTAGSTVVTSNYTLDTGQRDNYYDISRIVRKPSAAAPAGRLLIIHDYLEHSGTGDFYSVNSYVNGDTGISRVPEVAVNQMDYNDIPTYSATKIDPDEKEPTGVFPLADCFDFRPTVANIAGTQTSFYTDGGGGCDEITGNSFDFASRVFSGTGSSSLNFPKPNTSVQADFDYYLNKRALVFIDKDGTITVKEGASAEVPQLPKPNDGAMLLAKMFIPAFTFKPDDVQIVREKNQRFTMKDIGKLKDRIENIEYYTALNMLERDAESFEIQDANGLNRFKSGFVVDNFSGHRVGDAQHVDYKISMDFEKGEMRPIHHTEAVRLQEDVANDSARATDHYQKTGDLLTLPYTEEVFTSQPYATSIEKVTPLLTSNWLGILEITPSSDEWFETEIAPRLVINVEGNYDTFLAANRDKIGTVWNAWQTGWSGVVSTSTEMVNNNTGRIIQTSRQDFNRTGIRTEVVPKVDEESQGFRHLYDTLIPFCRSQTIQFLAWGLKPNTRVYPYFDKKNVSAHTTPLSSEFTSGTVAAGQPLVTTTVGNLEGRFTIPDPKVTGNQRFETGEVQFRLTSNSDNSTVPEPVTAADTIYFAKGILETHQETVIATRNAELVRTNVNETTSQFSTNSRTFSVPDEGTDDGDGGDGGDPLAQTFKVDAIGGIFITSIDLFFANKDQTLPMWVEIRNVVNGYPGPKILPFGRKVLYPADVTTSTDASVATKVTFPSPVYVEEGTEYTIALLTAAQINTWSVWIAKMGELEIGGTRTVSMQPHMGVLFKSHNNSAWAMSGMEDLKFTVNKAKFDISKAGTVTLNNTDLPNKKLDNNPLRFTDNVNTVRVTHRNHSMYAGASRVKPNNVTIAGVSTGITTTLNGSISDTSTTITLTSGTNFAETTGKFKHDGSGANTTSLHFIKIDDEVISYQHQNISGVNITSATRGVTGGGSATSHANGAIVELYQLFQVPLTEVNKTHELIGDVGGVANGNQLDFYTFETTTSVSGMSANSSVSVGGKNVTATQNKMLDGIQTMIASMELPNTKIDASVKATSGTSPSGTQESFTKDTAARIIPLNDNYYFDVPKLIASPINETNEMNAAKSLDVILSLTSTTDNLSPVIDTQRMSIFAIGNRINKVTGTSPNTISVDYSPSTDPEGDNNSAIYCTKQVALENPATAIKMFFAGNATSESDVVAMFKILRTDDSTDFDDIGWQYFNTTGVPDTTPKKSLSETDFQQYMYSAGVTDDGLGTPLEPFIGFAIKIILQGTNSAQVPRIKDLRAIALAT